MRHADVTPYAASLIEGLRDFGYSLETAMADVIDNSITAGARNISLEADTTSANPWIAIIDDGHGMDEVELIEAMRLGTKNPLDNRDAKDLGRFGLGLKSASFSQCRSLTVVSRKNGVTSCAAWDLDRVKDTNKWEIELISDWRKFSVTQTIGATGTAVIWQNLDRLNSGLRIIHPDSTKVLNESLSKAVNYLQLVFHRFMQGPNPRMILTLNGKQLMPHDPFVEDLPSRQSDPEEILRLTAGKVAIQSVTLPHHKRMTPARWEELGRGEGMLKTQGFYIYRAERLIIAGSWLGLAKQTELTKLARVRVDIPNSMDAEWKIDVKKASAQLPVVVRKRLSSILERISGNSKRVYQTRGRKLVSNEQLPLWERQLRAGKISFQPNLTHPALVNCAERLPEELRGEFLSCIRLLGAGFPLATLHADMHGTDAEVISIDADHSALRLQVQAIASFCRKQNYTKDDAAALFRTNELLKNNWKSAEELVEEILSDFEK